MPIYEVTDPNTGRILELEGDSPPTEQELNDIFSNMGEIEEPEPQDEQGFLSATGETVATMGRGVLGEVGGGLGALFELARTQDPEKAAMAMNSMRESIAKAPDGNRSQEQLQSLGGLIEPVIDAVNYPLSGLTGLAELATGQGIDQASQSVQNVHDDGISQVAGNRVFEETGSPLAATIAHSAPTAIAELAGLKGAKAGINATDDVAATANRAVDALPQIKPFTKGGKAKQRIGELIESGSADTSTARYSLPSTTGQKGVFGKLGEKLRIGATDVVADKAAIEAIKQGFDEGVIAAVKASNPEDQAKMLKMVNIMEQGKGNKLFAVKNRPSDVVGDSLMDRVRVIQGANRRAGKELEAVANNLKGEAVDSLPAINSFIDDLSDMGVYIGDDLIPNFSGSDIEGVTAAENAINKVVKRMTGKRTPDAHDLHRMKKFIDEQVTYGKAAEGLAGKSESVLKSLRRNLDNVLDSNFPEYDRVNTAYAETIGALDSLQDVAGRKMDLTGKNADKATGTLMRRVMSNAGSRVRLVDALDEIEGVANKYVSFSPKSIDGKLLLQSDAVKSKKGFNDDLLSQVLFADELDNVFKPVARTSFQGQIDQAINKGAQAATPSGQGNLVVEAAGKVAEKARGINEANAFKSIRELLERK